MDTDAVPTSGWMIAKGIPGDGNNMPNIIYTCYNMLVNTIMDTKCDASIYWYNKEIYVCLSKVLSMLTGEDFTIPESEKVISHQDVLSLFIEIGKNETLTCKIFHALKSLSICTLVIWMLKSVNEDKLHQDDFEKISNALTTPPFDCIIEDSVCKWSSRETLHVLFHQINASDLEKIEEHPDDLTQHKAYVAGFTEYNSGNYENALQLMQTFTKNTERYSSDLLQLNLANVFNLIGCCYANLGLDHTAILYFRKAIQCEDNHFACHLNNIKILYCKLGNLDAASQLMDMLVSSFSIERPERTTNHILLLHSKTYVEIAVLSNISHWGCQRTTNDSISAIYVAAKTSLRAEHYQKSAMYYDKILSEQNNTLSLENQKIKTLSLPSEEQILAERELARSGDNSEVNEEDKNEFAKMKMHFTQLLNKLDNLYSNLYTNCENELLKEFINTARTLYYCLCYTLCYSKRFVNNAEEENIIRSHLTELERFEITNYYPLHLDESNLDKNLLQDAKIILGYLNDVRAKLLLNKVIMLVCIDKNAETFQVLQNVLKLAPQDIEIRWKLTLMLWKLGYKNEACKTWMKTRALDYRMTAKQIMQTVSERSSKETGEREKKLYQRDVAILKELYTSKQLVQKGET
ncbi:uncharacterized protein LOC120327717 [Styela clava]